MKHSSPQFDNFEFTVARNVILGNRGSGKSKFLGELKGAVSALTDGAKVVYVEGGRAIKIQNELRFTPSNFNKYDGLEMAMRNYESKRIISLADRLFDAAIVLDKKDAQAEIEPFGRGRTVDRSGKNMSECPKRKQPPLEHLFELFNGKSSPRISLSYENQGRRPNRRKNGQIYGPSSLSDGEKQVFSILADFIELDESHRPRLVDEPELNLHPGCETPLWTLVEDEFLARRLCTQRTA